MSLNLTIIRSVKPIKQTVNQQGFSLIEIMVVVVIMATIITYVAGTISRDLDRLAKLESERFMVIVNEVRDEAIIAGESFLLFIDDKSHTYWFRGASSGRSGALDDGLLRVRSIEEGIELDWEVFDQLDNDSDDDEDKPASVLISPLGEITVFNVRFGGEETDFHVLVNDDNQLERQIKETRLF